MRDMHAYDIDALGRLHGGYEAIGHVLQSPPIILDGREPTRVRFQQLPDSLQFIIMRVRVKAPLSLAGFLNISLMGLEENNIGPRSIHGGKTYVSDLPLIVCNEEWFPLQAAIRYLSRENSLWADYAPMPMVQITAINRVNPVKCEMTVLLDGILYRPMQ